MLFMHLLSTDKMKKEYLRVGLKASLSFRLHTGSTKCVDSQQNQNILFSVNQAIKTQLCLVKYCMHAKFQLEISKDVGNISISVLVFNAPKKRCHGAKEWVQFSVEKRASKVTLVIAPILIQIRRKISQLRSESRSFYCRFLRISVR